MLDITRRQQWRHLFNKQNLEDKLLVKCRNSLGGRV